MNLFIAIFFIITGAVLRHLYLWKPKQMKNFYNNKPLFFAHRGYLLKKPENTLTSFLEAIKVGAQALEVDVVKTKDHKVICSHNHYLDVETNLVGNISEMEYSYIKKANTAHRLKNDKESIPQLISVIKNIPDEIKINIEIKTRRSRDIFVAREIVDIINNKNIVHRVLVSSFNPLVLWYVKWLDKNIRTGFLYDNPKLLFIKNIIHPDCIHPSESLITKNLVKHCKDRGLHINTWTVNNKPAIHWLSELGIDGIITDNPKFFSQKAI